MPKLKIFLVLLMSSLCFAVPFKTETVKEGAGDPIRSGQLIKVHYKGYLYLDSAAIAAEKARLVDSLRVADSLRLANDLSAEQIAGVSNPDNSKKKDAKNAPADTAKTEDTSAAVDTANVGNKLFADSYEGGEPLEFTLGMGQVIPGWEKGLVGMKVGEVRKLYVPYQMAYDGNSLDGIPAYSDLYFEVELVAAEKPMEPDVFPKNVEGLKWREVAKGLKINDEKVGSGKPTAIGSVLKVHYTGWLLSGRKFGSSKDMGKPLSVILGNGKMIKGWEQGLDGMREGGVRWFRISPNMGYGAQAFSMIPPNSTLIFRVELISSEVDEEIAEMMDFFPDTTTLKIENGSEGLRYAIIKEGEGEPAQKGINAKVHYTGWLTNGYKFDSSRDRGQPFDFPLGGGRVIRGWDLGVQGMLPGEKRILIVPPGLGYGSRGAGPIPGGSTLIFAVEYLGE
ncbi:FKBP-type peptidyl-prolyl cis-trans isomerase [Fibrobacter sp. UWEL]|uniref:FKBP-type peptidyl-prolyl cis-trans isomerase n=1 Tax=Fibrobacter sp. UWEL TaxID=1896209 RepID=UPI00090FB3B8|nr:FKBP-type peptidyl-prolyl cis-trans isomerase [Fibrobacter sp. UWEL]SHK74185.1 peptidylprolyl isomerase [Fibrobacter sp. UWEL]